MTADIVAV